MARGLEPAGVTLMAENLDAFVRDLNKADKAQKGLGGSVEKMAGLYRDANGRLRDAKGRFVDAGDSAESAGKQTAKAGEQAERAGPSFSILGSVITGVATAMTTFAIQAVAKVGQALVGLAQDSIGVATEFQSMETRLIIAAGTAGQVADQFGGLGEVALAVGGDTRLLGVSATGAADAMTGLLKAGIPLGDVMGDLNAYMEEGAELGGLLRASIDLAAATELNMVEASDLASITMATFAMTTTEAADAMDFMVRAADASVADVTGLRDAMANAGSKAASMGISFEDVTTSLAILSTRGIQGAEAGTALSSMMTNLMRVTPKVTVALEEQGISLYDSAGAMYSMPEIIGQFQIATEAMTDAQKNQFIQTVAGTYGMKSLATFLSNEGVEGWVDMEAAIASATGIQAQAEAQSKTYAAQQEALDGVMETLKIRIGTALLPALTGLVQIFSSLVDEYGPLLTSIFEGIGEAASTLVSAISEYDWASIWEGLSEGDISGLLESLSFIATDLGPGVDNAFRGIADAAEYLWTVFQSVRTWFDDNGPAIENALDQIGQVFQAVFGSIWEVIQDSVMPALQEVWAVFQETWDVIRDVLGEFGLEFDDTGSGIETVTGIIIGVIEVMGGIIAGVLTAVSGTVKFFAEHFQGVWMGIRDVVQGVKEWFEGFKQFWTALFNKDMPGALEGLERGFKGTAKFLKGMMKVIVKTITMPFKGLYKLIEGFVKGVIGFFKNLKKKLVGGSIIPDMMDKIEKVIDTVLAIILKVWEKVFEKILDVTQEIFASIERTVDRVMSAVEKIIDTICTAIGGDWEDFVDLLFELWEDTWDDIKDAVDTIFSAIEDLVDRIAGSIESLWDSFTETLEEVWENAWSAIEDFVDSTFNAIEDLIDSIAGSIESLWESFTETLEEVWETAWSAIEDFVDTTFNAIESLIDRIAGSIETAWNTFVGDIETAWETAWDNIEEAADRIFSAIETAIDTISDRIETAWGTFTGALETVWDTAWGNISDALDTVFEGIETAIDTISGRIETAWDTFTGNILSTWEGIWDDIDTKVTDIWGGIETFIDTGIQNLLGFFTDAAQDFIDSGAGVVDNIRTGIENTWQTVLDFVTGGLTGDSGSITKMISNALATIKTKAKDIVDAIRNGITEVWNRITSRITAMLKGTGGYAGIMFAITAAWTAIKNAGMQIINYIRDGLSDYFYRITTKLKDKLNDVDDGIIKGVTSAITAVQAAGAKIIDYIRTGLATAFYKVKNKLQDKLQGLKDSISDYTWGKINEIGGKLLGKIMDGVEAVTTWASDFWNWLWGEILDWLSWHSGEEVGEMMGDKITDGMVDSIRAQAGTRLLDALDYATGEALRGVGFQVPVQLSAAMQGGIEADIMRAAAGFSASLGMVAPAMMAPMAVSNSTEVNIGPVAINNGMDMAEFEVRVRQAVSEAI